MIKPTGFPDQRTTTLPPRWLRDAVMWSSARLAAGLQAVRGNRCDQGFGILMYHRVAPRIAGAAVPTWNVTPDRLRLQLEGLLDRGFEPWPLRRLIQAYNDSQPVPANAFAVTFDDGHANNYTQAWPVLRELNVPATIFLATAYLDSAQAFPFDDWAAAGSTLVPADCWQPMSTEQCRELLAGGLVDLGAHTHRHDRFLGRPEAFRQDMLACLAVLHDQFGIDAPTFAFPFGARDAEMIDIAKQVGVVCSLSTEYHRVTPNRDPFHWGRFNVESNDTGSTLAAKLSGWYGDVVAARKAVTRPLAGIVRGARVNRNNQTPNGADSKKIVPQT